MTIKLPSISFKRKKGVPYIYFEVNKILEKNKIKEIYKLHKKFITQNANTKKSPKNGYYFAKLRLCYLYYYYYFFFAFLNVNLVFKKYNFANLNILFIITIVLVENFNVFLSYYVLFL